MELHHLYYSSRDCTETVLAFELDLCIRVLLPQCVQAEMQLCTHASASTESFLITLHDYFHREILSTS